MSAQPASPSSGKDSFVHLHVHTEYSMLDGAARIDDLFKTAAEMGMPAIATTDHGYVFGAYEFWSKARKYGVKPIIGVEAYVTPGTHRTDKTRVKFGDGGRDDVSGSGAYTHMTLLAKNNDGMHNLFRMSSLASLEGYYFKPRMDRELLQTYGQGLVATTGCPSGEVQTRLRLGQYKEAVAAAAEFRDIFGAENYFCELMDHGLGIERQVQKDLLRLARELGLPLVATNDLHYTKPEDATAHAALLCVQSGSTLDGPQPVQVRRRGLLPQDARPRCGTLWRELPEACDNTLLIAERCDVSFTEGEGRFMPRFPCPPGENEESWFVKEVERGLHDRYPEGVPDYARKQAAFEIDVIVSKGYAGYFLVVADFIHWAKNNGIRVGPGRGSGAGSMCAYAMKITDLDPHPARPDLRAVPQPRAHVDARLRRRLRRAPPWRGHQVRDREVRRGARRPDRHLRHDQGQAGRQGRLPGHGPPLRHGREAHQGDAAGRHGQGCAAVRHLQLRAPALRRGRRVPPAGGVRARTPRRSSRPPGAWRA